MFLSNRLAGKSNRFAQLPFLVLRWSALCSPVTLLILSSFVIALCSFYIILIHCWPHTNSATTFHEFFRRLCDFPLWGRNNCAPHRYCAGSAGAPIRTPWYPWAGVPSPWSSLPPRLPFGAPSMIPRSKFWRTSRVSLHRWLTDWQLPLAHSLESNHTLFVMALCFTRYIHFSLWWGTALTHRTFGIL